MTIINQITSFKISGFSYNGTDTQLNYTAGVTAGIAQPSKALVLNASSNITSGINSITMNSLVTSDLTVNGTLFTTSTIANLAALDGATEGSATASKVLIVDSSRNIININSLSSSTLNGTLGTVAQPNITSLGTLINLTSSGVVSITNNTQSTNTTNGALIVTGGIGMGGALNIGGALSVTGNITGTLATVSQPNITTLSGITSIGASGATNITGTLQTASQQNITSIGTLTGLISSGIVSITNNTTSSSTITGALVVAGGVGIGGTLNVGGILNTGNSLSTSLSNNTSTFINYGDFINTGVSPNITTSIQMSNTGSSLGTTSNHFMRYITNNLERMRITTSGRLGIGTTNPDRSVEINSTDGNCLRLTYNDNDGSATTYLDQSISVAGVSTFNTVGSSPSFTFSGGPVSITNSTVSTSETTGALIITGGTGIRGSLNIGTTSRLGLINSSYSTIGTNGAYLQISNSIITDNGAGIGSTIANAVFSSFARPTLAATNTSVTTTNVATVYIENSPLSGTNMTISNAYALWAASGRILFGDSTISTTTTNGALVITGGVGVGGALNVGSHITTSGALMINKTSSPNAVADFIGSNSYLEGPYNKVIRCSGTNALPVQFEIQCNSGTNATSTNSAFIGTITTNDLRIGSSNSTRMIITSTGDIGIGKTNPSVRLDVSGVIKTSNYIQVGTSTDTGRLISCLDGITTVGSSRQITLGSSNTTGNQAEISFIYQGPNYTSNMLSFGFHGPNQILNILNNGSGNVGIGTTTPTSKLQVNGTMSASGITSLTDNTASSSTSTGALVVTGGVGIGGTLNVGGRLFLGNTEYGFSHRNTTGGSSEIVTYSDGINNNSIGTYTNNNFGIKTSDLLRLNISAGGDVSISNNTASSTTSTGALVVTGGVGIGGALNVGSGIAITPANRTIGATTSTNCLWISNSNRLFGMRQIDSDNLVMLAYSSGGAYNDYITWTHGATTNLSIAGSIRTTNNTASSSTSTGALIIDGGVGIQGATYIGNILAIGQIAQTSSSWTTSGIQLRTNSTTYTNSSTAISGTAVSAVFNSFARPTLAATNTNVTTTSAATVYIDNSPLAGTNMTITNAYALWAASGRVLFNDSTASSSSTTGALVVTGGVGIGGAINAVNTVTTTISGNGFIHSNLGVSLITNVVGANGIGLFGTTSNHPLGLITNSSERMRIAASGDVSISNSTVSSTTTSGALVVTGGVGIGGALNVGGNITCTRTTNGVTFSSVNGTSMCNLYHYNNGESYFGTVSNNNLVFQSNNIARMSIKATGNVNIINNLEIGGIAITSTADELNYNDLSTGPGTAEASKALVLDASRNIKNISRIQIGTNSTIGSRDLMILNTAANSGMRLGSAETNGNCTTMQWTYVGDNNANNRFGIDFFGKSNQFVILNSGNVGIGTSTPSTLLDVNGVIKTRNYIQVGQSTDIGRLISCLDNNTTVGSGRQITLGVSNNAGNQAELNFVYQGSNNSSNRLSMGFFGNDAVVNLLNSGNVGIGTTTPTSTLQVNGSLSKTSGTFDIKHPTKTKTRLVHSFIEGPRCDLIYRGEVKLINGTALVNLDKDCVHLPSSSMTEGTFIALVQNPVCYLQNSTFDRVIGSIANNILTIRCENLESNAIVNWMVIGERKDIGIKEWVRTDSNGYLITEYSE